MRCVTAALSICVLLILAHVSHGASSAYPCHDGKNAMGNGVTCTEVAIPPGLCTSCPLRPPNSKGQFVKCWDILETEKSSCLGAMRQYVNANPCDPIRAEALDKLEANPDDKPARQIIDYFLYSLCEQCCDCVPMGANDEFFSQYQKAHTPSDPALYDPARGNCPAHAYYDVCKVLPKVTSFHKIGASPKSGMPPACPLLREWFVSPASKKWQDNPQTELSSGLRAFLLNMLQVHDCAKKQIWGVCYDLEEKQKHLGVPEDNPSIDDSSPSTGSKPAEPQVPEEPSSGTDTSPSSGSGTGSDGSSGSSTPSTGSGSSGSTDSSTPSSGSSGSGSISEPGSTAPPGVSAEPQPRECFPSHATVQLRDGSVRRMDQLRIGDMVRVSAHPPRWERVYLFSHSDRGATSRYVRIRTSTGHVVDMTAGHMLQVNGQLVDAASLKPGDSVQTVHGTASVRTIAVVHGTGLFNPHTPSGSVVVDGVVCSTFTQAVEEKAANALLAPMRALFRAGALTHANAAWFLQSGASLKL